MPVAINNLLTFNDIFYEMQNFNMKANTPDFKSCTLLARLS